MKIRVVGAQLAVTNDIGLNTTGILRAIEWARTADADILLTPEGSLSGYTPHFDVRGVRRALECVTAAARAARVGLALGTCFVEAEDHRCYDQMRFYDPAGQFLGFHSKILTCGSLTMPPMGEINDYAYGPLRTFELKGTCIGGLICNDMWANPECTPMPDPHLSQQLAKRGARIILHAVNGGRDGGPWSDVGFQYHEANLRMRARAGHVWIVTVDSCSPLDLRCSAPSGVVAPDGHWACRVEPQGEQYFTYSIDPNADEAAVMPPRSG
jgi:predicted amidohydrolase